MSTIKQIQEQWETFHKDPSKNPPVSDEDLKKWANHINDTANMLKEYPDCRCAYYYLTQQEYSLGLVLNARGIFYNRETDKW
jgi:hypothetical protein